MLSLNTRAELFRFHLYTISNPDSTEDEMLEAFLGMEEPRSGCTKEAADVLRTVGGFDIYEQFVKTINELNAVVTFYWVLSNRDPETRIQETYNHTKWLLYALYNLKLRKVLYDERLKFRIGPLLRGNFYWFMRVVNHEYWRAYNHQRPHGSTENRIHFDMEIDDLHRVLDEPYGMTLIAIEPDTPKCIDHVVMIAPIRVGKPGLLMIDRMVCKTVSNMIKVTFTFSRVMEEGDGSQIAIPIPVDLGPRIVVSNLVACAGVKW